MQSSGLNDSDPLDVAKMNHLFKETLEAWLSSCRKRAGEEKETSSEGVFVTIDSGEQLLVLVAHLALLEVGFEVQEKGTDDPYFRLPSGWNATEPYCFQYTHAQSHHHFQVKAITIGNQLIIHAAAVETNETHLLNVTFEDFVINQATFPLRLESAAQIAELDLSKLFSSHGKLTKYLTEFQLQVVQKLIPDLQIKGYHEIPLGGKACASPPQPRSPQGQRDNFGPSLGNLSAPNFPEGRHPLAYGDRDLNPLSGVGSGLPRFGGGGNAMDPFGMIGDDQGGMILGPHHPMFSNPNAPPFSGGDSRLPPGAAPPGARFDPITPFDPSNRDPRSRLRGQHPRPPFSGEPDNDEAPPPVRNIEGDFADYLL